MREIAIHGHEHLVASVVGPSDATDVGATNTQLAGTMLNEDTWVAGGELIEQIPGSIRRIVVDEQNVSRQAESEKLPEDELDILPLVVRRYEYQQFICHRSHSVRSAPNDSPFP